MTKTKEAVRPAQLLTVEDVAGLLQVPIKTVRDWRLRGQGPDAMRVGRYVRFDPVDVVRWIDERRDDR